MKLPALLATEVFSRFASEKQMVEKIVADECSDTENNDSEKIISSLLLLVELRKELSSYRNKALSSDAVEMLLEGMVLLNSQITNYLIQSAQRKKQFSFDDIYSQSSIVIEYLVHIRDDMRNREILQNANPDLKIIDSNMLKCVKEFDLDILEAHLDYLILVTILMCICISPFCDDIEKNIASCFLDNLSSSLPNCRIEDIFMEPNVYFSESEPGNRTSTKLEIFFSLNNEDKYQLRVDFPHKGVDYIHFNLYEPYAETAFPIDAYEYTEILKNHGDIVDKFFYKSGSKWWFRNSFSRLIKDLSDEQSALRDALESLFNEHQHYRAFPDNISESSVKAFLDELFAAINVFEIKHSKYMKPKLIDENEQLENIVIAHNLRKAAYIIDEVSFYHLLARSIPEEIEIELASVEEYLRNVLVKRYGGYKKKELYDCSSIELFEFVYENFRK